MAKAIRTRPAVPARSRDAARGPELAEDLARSAEALRELLEVVRLLDERGVLRFSTDLLRSEDRLVEVLTDRFDPNDVRRTLRNLEALVRGFREVDPRALDRIARAVPGAMDEAERSAGGRPLGLFDMANALREPEVNRGVRMLLGFLRGLGRELGG